jgi:hypothetical protein
MEFSEKLELIPLFKILNGKLFEDLDDSRIINDDFDLDDFDLDDFDLDDFDLEE